ncbi:MAG: hypothetical protein WCM76_09080 [Bacteroidota bacterium]
MGLKNIIRKIQYNREAGRNTRNKLMTSLAEAKSIGILYNVEDEQLNQRFTAFVSRLQSERKEVRTLGFIKYKDTPHYCFPKLMSDYVTRRTTTWYGKPFGDKVRDFANKEFDILFNLDLQDNPTLLYITGISQAKLKVGKFNEAHTSFFDLMIAAEAGVSVESFCEQVITYMNMIKTSR